MNHKIKLPEDTFKHQGMRKRLIEQIQDKGIKDENVLSAMMKVPRHFFFNQAFKIGAGQTISQPFTVAYQTSLLTISRGEKILEIGTGSGYQTAILCAMGAKVFSIERQKELFDRAYEILPLLSYSPKLFHGDGFKGLPSFAPFDKILITCGAPYIPDPLVNQLKVGGWMVVPVGAGEIQIMTLVKKTSEITVQKEELKSFRFVPMLENKAWGNS